MKYNRIRLGDVSFEEISDRVDSMRTKLRVAPGCHLPHQGDGGRRDRYCRVSLARFQPLAAFGGPASRSWATHRFLAFLGFFLRAIASLRENLL